jgi:hypothetical protein
MDHYLGNERTIRNERRAEYRLGFVKKEKGKKAAFYDSFLTKIASSRTKVMAAMTATTSTYV